MYNHLWYTILPCILGYCIPLLWTTPSSTDTTFGLLLLLMWSCLAYFHSGLALHRTAVTDAVKDLVDMAQRVNEPLRLSSQQSDDDRTIIVGYLRYHKVEAVVLLHDEVAPEDT